MQRYENENLNTIVLFLLSSVSRFFGAVFLRLLAHMRKYCIEVFGSHHSKFRAGNERPGCSLQFWNFIRYCPSGRPAGRFAVGCFVFGCLFKALAMRGESLRFTFVLVRKEMQLLPALLEKNR